MKNRKRSRRRPGRISKTVRFMCILYFLGVILGLLVTCFIQIYKPRADHLQVAHMLASNYASGLTVNAILPGEHIVLTDENGDVIMAEAYGGNSISDNDITKMLKHMPQVLSGESVYIPILTDGLNIAILTGVPLPLGFDADGALFALTPVSDLFTYFFAFIIVFSLISVISASNILYAMVKNYRLEEMRRAYIADVSHNLKAPVTSVRALVETMVDGLTQDPESMQRYFNIILNEMNYLERAIKGMLELSKMQSYQLDFPKSAVPASQIFDSVCEKYQILCEDRDIRFDVSETITSLPKLYTNTGGVVQLLEILLDNAMKFVEEDGRIWLEAASHGSKAIVCVRDNGIGIAKEILPHVFERFYKGNPAYDSVGTGLGLAIANEIVLALDEKLWAQSVEGDGAAFYFSVRLG